jgi:hypothetical protein
VVRHHGDSFVVDVRPITGDPVEGFLEVFKYAVKFSDQPPADTWHAYSVLKGKRLLGSAGCFRGVEVPDELNDELLDDLPYVDLFYRFLRGWAIAFLLRNAPSRRSRLEAIAGVSLAWNAADAP